MKVVKYDPSSAVATQTPIMVGDVASQVLVGEIDSKDIRVTSVTFRDGARNRFHRHSCDQILIVVEGRGVIATAEDSTEVERGDVIVIPAGDLHWHGALVGETFTHLSIIAPHETTFEEPVGYSPSALAGAALVR
ncbi:cupin domain-containing protein [soil metagenome]